MKGMVNGLVLLIRGASKSNNINSADQLSVTHTSRRKLDSLRKPLDRDLVVQRSNQVNSSEIIPLDDDDFKDF